jgi:hypothetical protein
MCKTVEGSERKRHSGFVDFMNDARNTIHSNTRYHGPSKKIEVRGQLLHLRDGELTDFLSHSKLMQIVPAFFDAFLYLHPEHVR